MKAPKTPTEDPEVRARREMAERRADAGRIEELSENVDDTTSSFVRKFGRLAGTGFGFSPIGGASTYTGPSYTPPSTSSGMGGGSTYNPNIKKF